MKPKHAEQKSPASALGGGRQTAKVVAEARRLTDSVRKLGIPKPKPKYRLEPALGTTKGRASRFGAL